MKSGQHEESVQLVNPMTLQSLLWRGELFVHQQQVHQDYHQETGNDEQENPQVCKQSLVDILEEARAIAYSDEIPNERGLNTLPAPANKNHAGTQERPSQ